MEGTSHGRAYTQREYKAIIDYIKDRKAYDKVRGRTMWFEFASSNLTTRTWQSLKETFRKRIMPRIQDPYFKLTKEEIRSFRLEKDLTNKNVNKLEFEEDKSTSEGNNTTNAQPSTSHRKANEEDVPSGEENQVSKITSSRESTETVRLSPDNCYNNAQELLNVLESPAASPHVDTGESPKKTRSLRDCIAYSEPLTPLLQQIIEDFDSEDEVIQASKQNTGNDPANPQAEVEEPPKSVNEGEKTNVNVEPNGNNNCLPEAPISKSPTQMPSKPENYVKEKITRSKTVSTESNDSDVQIIEKENQVHEIVDTATEDTNNDVVSQSILRAKGDFTTSNSQTNNEASNQISSGDPNSIVTVQNSSSFITDSLIPNNQEALPAKSNGKKILGNNKSVAQNDEANKITINRGITCSKPEATEKHEKGHKRQRKLFSVTQSEIALSKEKRTTLSDLNEDLDEEQCSTKAKQAKAKTSKHVKFVEDGKNVEKTAPVLENAEETLETQQKHVIMDSQESHQSTNPCLQSVSLFAEQNMPTEIDSDSDDVDTSPRTQHPSSTIAIVHQETQFNPVINKVKQHETGETEQEVANSSGCSRQLVSLEINVKTSNLLHKEDVILLKSHSDTDTTEDIQITGKRKRKEILRRQKQEVLNDLFGSTSGIVSKRRRLESERNGSLHTKHHNRKRKSQSVGGLPHERVLYVPSGKQWDEGPLYHYDGQGVSLLELHGLSRRNSYDSNHVSEEEDSIWKLKYVKERKRNESLQKLLESVNDGCADSLLRSVTTDSPILPFKSFVKPKPIVLGNGTKSTEAMKGVNDVLPDQLGLRESKGSVIKTKVQKDYVEIYVECRRERLQTALQFVMQELNMDAATTAVVPKACDNNKGLVTIEVSSGNTTPLNVQVDEEARKKTLALENEILEKIQEADKSDMDLKVAENVTERPCLRKESDVQSPTASTSKKTKQVKTSEPTVPKITVNSPKRNSKRIKTPTEAEPETKSENSTEKPSETSTDSGTGKQDKLPNGSEAEAKMNGQAAIPTETRTRGRRSKIASESKNNSDAETVNEGSAENVRGPPRRRGRFVKVAKNNLQPRGKNSDEQTKISVPEDDSQVLYKFPSPEPAVDEPVAKKSSTITTRARKYLPRTPEISSPDCTQNTTESSQGYQDSDLSPQTGNFMRKKKYSLPTLKANEKYKFTRNFRRHTFNHLDSDTSSESSNSNFRFPVKNITSSSLNTEAYRSESYQLLMPKPTFSCHLEQISESPCPNEVDPQCDANCLKLSPASQNLGSTSEAGNSSNVSLPLSPELSIVENISISKDDLEELPHHPTINETTANVEMKSVSDEIYTISNVDVSVPLMQQKCNFYNYQDTGISNLSEGIELKDIESLCGAVSPLNEVPASVKCNNVTDTLLDRMETASIDENITTSDLDIRLRNMLLESAKKIAEQNKMAIEMSGKEVEVKKKQTRKRCSTPRKKKETTKSQTPKVEPVIEECMEYCLSGRKSCPPVICDTENLTANDSEIVIETNNPPKTKTAKAPKEIIKVKILRPKKKSEKSPKKAKTKARRTLSVLTDSGINDTSVSILLQSMNESVDFIHNHSETCLQANECVSCDLEFTANSPKYVPSCHAVDISSESTKENKAMMRRRSVRDSMTPEFFSCDAQSGSCFKKITQPTSQKPSQTGSEYHSAQCSSLITEDLSDEAALPDDNFNKWYLLSDDETNNSVQSSAKPATCSVNSSYGSNLRQLFPVVCSVPDLSDITEFSKETDGNSCKSTRNTDFDSNTGTLGRELLGSDLNDTSVVNVD